MPAQPHPATAPHPSLHILFTLALHCRTFQSSPLPLSSLPSVSRVIFTPHTTSLNPILRTLSLHYTTSHRTALYHCYTSYSHPFSISHHTTHSTQHLIFSLTPPLSHHPLPLPSLPATPRHHTTAHHTLLCPSPFPCLPPPCAPSLLLYFQSCSIFQTVFLVFLFSTFLRASFSCALLFHAGTPPFAYTDRTVEQNNKHINAY